MDTTWIIARQVSLILMVSTAIVVCEPALSNQYGVPGNFGGNNHGPQGGSNGFGGNYENGQSDTPDYAEPKSYEFGYAVRDQITGNDFGRREASDGETVRGEYRVQLPDGRTQIVTYTADWRTGFHADVRYEGTASYPDQYNGQNGGQGNNLGNGYNGGGNGNGYGNYRAGGNGNNYPYQYGSNSIENGYNNFGGSSRNGFNAGAPSPTYGPAFRH